MKVKPRIICTVTNSLNQDQRMHRICGSLTKMGFKVLLVGRTSHQSLPLLDFAFSQKRIKVVFQRGFLFYAEYNLKLFWFLLFQNHDITYSVDLDSLIPGSLIKTIRNKQLVFDAHEYFTETPELAHRSFVKWVWTKIANTFVKKADHCISVNESLSKIFQDHYGKPFVTIYNCPDGSDLNTSVHLHTKPYLLYQGVLNKGRGLEAMIEAMDHILDVDLLIIGEGDLSDKLRTTAMESTAADRIKFLGWLSPKEIREYTNLATLGINLLDSESRSYYYSLANKFFDYMHAEVPSVNMDFPEYRNIIEKHEIGVLLKDLNPSTISEMIVRLLKDKNYLLELKQNCILAKKEYDWKNEELKLHTTFKSFIRGQN